MRKLILFILLLIVLSFLLGYVLSLLAVSRRTERTGIIGFSVETRAVCEELKETDCYYKCHDEVFLIVTGKEISLHKNNEYVCHEEGWVDPRIRK